MPVPSCTRRRPERETNTSRKTPSRQRAAIMAPGPTRMFVSWCMPPGPETAPYWLERTAGEPICPFEKTESRCGGGNSSSAKAIGDEPTPRKNIRSAMTPTGLNPPVNLGPPSMMQTPDRKRARENGASPASARFESGGVGVGGAARRTRDCRMPPGCGAAPAGPPLATSEHVHWGFRGSVSVHYSSSSPFSPRYPRARMGRRRSRSSFRTTTSRAS